MSRLYCVRELINQFYARQVSRISDQKFKERLCDLATRMQLKRKRKRGVGTRRRKGPGAELKRGNKQRVLMN